MPQMCAQFAIHRFVSIAQFLIESNADLAAVNSDGDLAIDLAESDRMRHLMEKHLIEQGIDCDEARQSEEKLMLHDAETWLRSDASEADKPHPRTGATALHVASAKGYSKVLSLLLATRADVDKQDNDGWTPLHAAARWGQKEAAQMLVASLADMDVKNYAVGVFFLNFNDFIQLTDLVFFICFRVKQLSMWLTQVLLNFWKNCTRTTSEQLNDDQPAKLGNFTAPFDSAIYFLLLHYFDR